MFKTIRLVIFWAKILKYIKNSTSLYKNFNFNIVHIILLFVWSRFRWNSWTLFSNQPIKFTVRSFVIILNYIKIIEITNKRFVVLIYGINSPLTNFLLRCVCVARHVIWSDTCTFLFRHKAIIHVLNLLYMYFVFLIIFKKNYNLAVRYFIY